MSSETAGKKCAPEIMVSYLSDVFESSGEGSSEDAKQDVTPWKMLGL